MYVCIYNKSKIIIRTPVAPSSFSAINTLMQTLFIPLYGCMCVNTSIKPYLAGKLVRCLFLLPNCVRLCAYLPQPHVAGCECWRLFTFQIYVQTFYKENNENFSAKQYAIKNFNYIFYRYSLSCRMQDIAKCASEFRE